jgi:precorrin-6B methylase 2
MAKVRNILPLTIEWTNENRREVFVDSLVKKYNWTVGCEVGVRFGRTLFYLLDSNPNLKMYAVDKDVSQFYNSSVKEKYKDRLVVLEGISWKQAEHLPMIDFAFIDAGHSYKNVSRDIVAYDQKIKDVNGLLGHDVDYPSIQRALKSFDISYGVGPDNVWFRI